MIYNGFRALNKKGNRIDKNGCLDRSHISKTLSSISDSYSLQGHKFVAKSNEIYVRRPSKRTHRLHSVIALKQALGLLSSLLLTTKGLRASACLLSSSTFCFIRRSQVSVVRYNSEETTDNA